MLKFTKFFPQRISRGLSAKSYTTIKIDSPGSLFGDFLKLSNRWWIPVVSNEVISSQSGTDMNHLIPSVSQDVDLDFAAMSDQERFVYFSQFDTDDTIQYSEEDAATVAELTNFLTLMQEKQAMAEPADYEGILAKYVLSSNLDELDGCFPIMNDPFRFNPERHISSHIFSIIQKAQKSLFISTYNASDPMIFCLIGKAVERGVVVHFAIDSKQAQRTYFAQFDSAVKGIGVESGGKVVVQATHGPSTGCTHDRIVLADDRWCTVTSSDLSTNSRKNNYEFGYFSTKKEDIDIIKEFMKNRR